MEDTVQTVLAATIIVSCAIAIALIFMVVVPFVSWYIHCKRRARMDTDTYTLYLWWLDNPDKKIKVDGLNYEQADDISDLWANTFVDVDYILVNEKSNYKVDAIHMSYLEVMNYIEENQVV